MKIELLESGKLSFRDYRALRGMPDPSDKRIGEAINAQIVAQRPAAPAVPRTVTAVEGGRIAHEFIQDIATRKIGGVVATAQQIARDAAGKEMPKFFTWVANTFMVGDMTSEGQAVLAAAGVVWEPLSPKYLSEKQRLGMSSGFWQYTGKLQRQFRSGNSGRRKMFGEIMVSLKPGGGAKFKYQLEIDVAPDLEGVTGRTLENLIAYQAFGGNEEMVKKLQGRVEYYRPLLGPAMNYYIKNMVQAKIVQALNADGFKVKRIASSSGVGVTLTAGGGTNSE